MTFVRTPSARNCNWLEVARGVWMIAILAGELSYREPGSLNQLWVHLSCVLPRSFVILRCRFERCIEKSATADILITIWLLLRGVSKVVVNTADSLAVAHKGNFACIYSNRSSMDLKEA